MTGDKENIEVSLRSLAWMGDSRKNIREFPEEQGGLRCQDWGNNLCFTCFSEKIKKRY